MVYFLYGIFFLSCLVLVAAVLLQPGKTDAGALFTSNVSSSAFAPRGTATVLSKVTIAAATTFMLSALFLAMPALTGNVSVLNSNPDAPADATSSNANTDSNSAVTNMPPDANASGSTGANVANSALIETPATDEERSKAVNAAVANANAKAAAPAANAAKTAPAKPAPKATPKK